MKCWIEELKVLDFCWLRLSLQTDHIIGPD